MLDSDSYATYTKAPEAHQATLRGASAMSVVGARVVVDQEFAQETQEAWAKQMKSIKADETIADFKKVLGPYKKVRKA